ncbi:hypothetical protein BDN71DRAFT_1590049 [Pleurotus eryngii]|uniref:Aminoglycoside phosphotransferase domain-containing protein n=1 Tax=Pleurotus eryngii TaxID=5323 RepID=A0A9P6D8B4_PLEER|nr:hypothetical protein BDN71DRAFT_1590049 [Pleurotus eryngii]
MSSTSMGDGDLQQNTFSAVLEVSTTWKKWLQRTFLITMYDGFRMVARIPYPITTPKHLAIASEVATLTFLRSAGLPTPAVYGYSPTLNNAAGTKHIFMQFVWKTPTWERHSILHQIVELETEEVMRAFLAGGSLYFTEDLAEMARTRVIALDAAGGPFLTAGAEKELAYLPAAVTVLAPGDLQLAAFRSRREPQPLSKHCAVADSKQPSIASTFAIQPFRPGNIIVSRRPDCSSYRVVGLTSPAPPYQQRSRRRAK